MALTATQQTQIRQYLGYADLNRYKNTRLEGVIASGILSPEAETLVGQILLQLVAVDAALTGTGGTAGDALAKAGIKAVDEIQFFQGQTVADLRKIGRQLVGRLSVMFGVPPYGDAFGEGGWPGDAYSAIGLAQGGRGGNIIPQG